MLNPSSDLIELEQKTQGVVTITDKSLFTLDNSKLLKLTKEMIIHNEVKTTLEFAQKFMFTFDSEEQFPINIDMLIDMKVYDKKGHCKTKLTKNFILDTEFKVQKGGSGLLKENIMITIDCFKSMCMLANSEAGKQIKLYYLDLEKIFNRYNIIKFQEAQIQLNEHKLEQKEHKEHKEIFQTQSSDIVEFKLTLKNNTELSIPVSKDGYVNCTKLCQAGNKRIDKWIANKQSKELLEAYSKLPRIRGSLILRAVEGKNGGSYYPMDIAIQIAQWIDPYFALQVSNWTRELLLFGSVTLGKEKSNEELENKFQEQINNLHLQLTHSNLQLKNEQIEKQKYLTLHNQHIKKHNFHKFKKNGPCFYIIVSGLEYKDEITRIKIGICGCRKKKTSESVINSEDCSLDHRLASHRTLWPQLQVKFAVYTEHAALLESNMKLVYQAQINPNGHELIERVPIFDVIEKTKMFLNNFNGYNNDIQTYCIEENIEQYNVNTLTHIKNNILQITEVIEEKKEKIEIIKDDIKEAKEVIYEQIEVIKESEEKLVKINAEIAEYKIHLAKNIEEYKDAELKDLLSKCNMTKNGKKYEKFNRFKLHITKEIDRLIILKNQNL